MAGGLHERCREGESMMFRCAKYYNPLLLSFLSLGPPATALLCVKMLLDSSLHPGTIIGTTCFVLGFSTPKVLRGEQWPCGHCVASLLNHLTRSHDRNSPTTCCRSVALKRLIDNNIRHYIADTDGINNVQANDDFAEDGVFVIEGGNGVNANVELAAGGIWIG